MEHSPEQDISKGLTRAEWLLLLVLAAVQFVHSMDFMVMMPLGPQCREELSISPRQFAFVVSSYGFSAAIAGLFAAFFIDRFDRKNALLMLLAGLTGATLLCAAATSYRMLHWLADHTGATFLGATATSYWILILARIVAGGFGGIGGAFILVIIGDAFPEIRRGRATGVVMSSFSVASIAGLPVGIMLGNRFGVWAPFAILGFLGLLIWILAFRVLPPMRGHLGRQRPRFSETMAVLRQPAHLRAYAFMIMLVLGSFTMAPHFSDFVVHNVGRAKNELAYVYLCGGLLTLVTLPMIGRWSDRYGKRLIFRIMAGLTLTTVLALSNLPPLELVPVLVVTTLYMIFTSGRFVPAMALITSSALARYRGSFMSINASVQQMAMGLAAVIAGAVVSESPEGKIIGYPIVGVLGAIATGISIVLAGQLRVANEIPESSVAVDSPEAMPLLAGAPAAEPGA